MSQSSHVFLRKAVWANVWGLGSFIKAGGKQQGALPLTGLPGSSVPEVLMCQGSFDPPQVPTASTSACFRKVNALER